MNILWFFIRSQKLTESVSALGAPKNVCLNTEDEDVVCQLMERNNVDMNPQKIVTLQPKIIIGNKIIFSQYSGRVQKRNSYTVAFADPEIPNCIKYG